MQAVIHFFKTLDAKRKSYFYVFFGLCVLTVLELAFLHLPFSQTVITIMICVASLAKALIVGWVYMHLNHETKGLKVLLLFPLFVAFFYAIFLIADSRLTVTRHADPYIGMPERTYGPRNVKVRKLDDFGNPIVEAPAMMHGTHAEEKHSEAEEAEPSSEEHSAETAE